jgi:hypothetical protein
MAAMEFSYKLTESEYLSACKIPVKRPGRNWTRISSYVYNAILLLTVWGAVVLGMLLESWDLVGINAADVPHLHTPAAILPASIVPALGYFALVLMAFRLLRPTRWLAARRRREHFRADPQCQAETRVTVTVEGVSFHSATGSSQSIWSTYSTWAERGGVLLLVTHAGVRKILCISKLTDPQRAELRGLLAAVLPQK